MKKLSFLITFLLCSIACFCQDTTTVQPAINTSFDVFNFINNMPQWFYVAVLITGATLTATQTILSLFPTERSVKITGVIGKILDVLALFPKDNKIGGGTHK